jgi:antagonist of KipI
MKAKLIVNNAGFFTTVQDIGRFGYQQYGVPVSGAMDKYALQVANILVGNHRREAVLEIALPGFEGCFTKNTQIAVTGADLGALSGDRELYPWQAVTIKEGELLRFTEIKNGTRAYLAVAGGFDIPEVMGSKSTYVRGRLGGLKGRQLQKGDELELKGAPTSPRLPTLEVPPECRREYPAEATVRCIPGPQDDFFPLEEVEKFFCSQYTITPQSDRMGYRLDGPAIKHKQDYNIITEGLALGAIQVIGDGKPIVMMADHHSAGGYTKIAHVINADIPFLAQMKPGDRVSFKHIEIEEAQELLRQQEKKLIHLEEYFAAETKKLKAGQQETDKTKHLRVVVDGKEFRVQIEEVIDQ